MQAATPSGVNAHARASERMRARTDKQQVEMSAPASRRATTQTNTARLAWRVGALIAAVFVGACSGEDFQPSTSTGGTSGDSGLGGTDGGGNGGTGGTSGTGGSGGTSGSDAGDAATCDTTKSPSEESCLVADDYAIFVSPTGSDSADGSKGTPVASWEKALEPGKAAGKIVLACNDDFTSPVALTNAHSGTKLYGGFKCSDWSYEASKKTRLAPSSEAIALSLDGVVGFHAEDVIIEAKDATAAGASSIAVFASASSGITLERVDLKAGKGAAGAKGVVTAFTYPAQSALDGKNANGATGGGSQPVTCPGGLTTTGGLGGTAGPQGGGLGLPDLGGGKAGVIAGVCAGPGGGGNGASPPPAPNAAGASTLGTLTTTGWTPSAGADAKAGSPGQGGGGGASDASFGGGGGGAGGCGGAGGPAGKGGGASIALLLLDTPLSLNATITLATSDGGKGGDGAAGQAGQTIFGFKGNGAGSACQGGNGAPGAAGGAGGGAAGGISVAVVWKGAAALAPSIDASTKVTLGALGTKGIGGKAGSNDGIDGLAQDVLEVK